MVFSPPVELDGSLATILGCTVWVDISTVSDQLKCLLYLQRNRIVQSNREGGIDADSKRWQDEW